MKIIFVNSCRYLGGAELWHLRTAAGLRRRGHTVKLLVRPGPLADQAAADGLPVITLPMAFDLDLYSLFQAFWWFRREKPELVLLNDQRECRIIAPAAALAGIRVRVQRKGWPFLKGSFRDRLVYRRFVTHLFAPSEAVAGVFREKSGLAPGRIRVIPNGVRPEFFAAGEGREFRRRLGIKESEPVAGTAGRLVSQKGIDLLLEAAARLQAGGRCQRILIAGEGKEKERLQTKARAAGLQERVLFLGQVADMPAFLSALDLFVFPSRQEGRSNALAEAMAVGLPIVATDIPANNELLSHEKTGILVPPDHAAELTAAIIRLLEDRDLAAQLGRAARTYAEESLREEKVLDQLETYLEELIRETAGSNEDK